MENKKGDVYNRLKEIERELDSTSDPLVFEKNIGIDSYATPIGMGGKENAIKLLNDEEIEELYSYL